MTHDQNKKTLRSFQCRDYLWEIFEQMSNELECSIDYLINESMRQYARSRSYGNPAMGTPATGTPAMGSPSLGVPRVPSSPGMIGSPDSNMGYGPPGAAPGYGPLVPSQPPRPPGGLPAAAPQPPQPPPQYQQPPSYAPSAGPSSAPPPLPGHGAFAPPQGRRALYVIFNGQKLPVQKDEFVIGRGAKTADLPIKDGNISRRHAAVVFMNGAYYMKDLGSTNGIEFAGQRVDSKEIAEGDIFQICDYEIRFTYQ